MSAAGTRRPLDLALGVAAIGLAAAAVVAMALRLRWGVDFQDEAYYTALAYRFVLGDRPFVDEMHFLQLSAMLTYPFVKAYVALAGGTTGIVLFMRVVWLLFAVGVSAAGFAFLRYVMRWQLALLACLLPLLAPPFNIPSLSYNSLAAGLLAAGVALGGLAIVFGRSRWWLVPAGVAHGLVAWAYPTLALAVLAFAVAILALERRGAARPLAAYVGGAAAVGAVLGAIVLRAGIGNVVASARYMSTLSDYAGGEGKFVKIAGQAGWLLARQPLFPAALAVAIAAVLLRPRLGRWLLPLVPLAAVWPLTTAGMLPYTVVMAAITMYGLVGVALWPLVRGKPRARRLYGWAVLPSLAAALVTAYTSSNGFTNAAIGFCPALFATSGMLAMALEPAEHERGLAPALLPWVLTAVLVLTALRFGQYQYGTVYHDSPPGFLTAEVTAGPFAGLWTRPANAALEKQVREDVEKYVRPGDAVLFHDNFPAGYLYSNARPAANTLWLSGSDDNVGPRRHATLAWWKRTGRYPDVAFHWLWRVRHPGRVIATYVAAPRYRAVADRGRYRVWVRAR